MAWPARPILPIPIQEVLYTAPRALVANLNLHKSILSGKLSLIGLELMNKSQL